VRGSRHVALLLGGAILLAACGATDTSANDVSTTPASDPAATLQMRPVESIALPDSTAYDDHEPTCGVDAATPCTDVQLLDPDGITLDSEDVGRAVLGALVIDGSNVASASAVEAGDPAEWVVQLTLDHEGTTAVATATGNAASATPPANQIAIVVDGTLLSLPVVQAPIDSGLVVVSAGFTKQEAEDLAAALGGS
jgi:preprotein translocase subunit SecD